MPFRPVILSRCYASVAICSLEQYGSPRKTMASTPGMYNWHLLHLTILSDSVFVVCCLKCWLVTTFTVLINIKTRDTTLMNCKIRYVNTTINKIFNRLIPAIVPILYIKRNRRISVWCAILLNRVTKMLLKVIRLG